MHQECVLRFGPAQEPRWEEEKGTVFPNNVNCYYYSFGPIHTSPKSHETNLKDSRGKPLSIFCTCQANSSALTFGAKLSLAKLRTAENVKLCWRLRPIKKMVDNPIGSMYGIFTCYLHWDYFKLL